MMNHLSMWETVEVALLGREKPHTYEGPRIVDRRGVERVLKDE